jgi:phenylpyruvate tautomerase PptA (4-oxalocrotonate tautomerase family)
MPLVKVEMYKGKSSEYKKGLLDGIHNALVDAFKIPSDDRNQRIYELDENNCVRRANKTNNFTLIEIIAFKGRTDIAKKDLYRHIFTNLKINPGIDEKDILVYIHEPELINWGIRGTSGDEIDFGFNLKV